MSAEQTPASSKKKLLILRGAILSFGVIVGFFLADQLHVPGCTTRVALDGFEVTCSGPSTSSISFGRDGSSESLARALHIVEDVQGGARNGRIYVEDDVYRLAVVDREVRLPQGEQPVVHVLEALLEDAGARDHIDICLVASGGYRLQPVCREEVAGR